VTYYATGENNIPDLVKELKPVSFDGKAYLFSYQVSTLNRTEKEDIGFTLSMLFEGNKQPKIDVVAKGINTQAFAWEHSPYQQNLTTKALILLVLFLLIFIILMVLVIGPFMSWISRPFDRKSDKTYAKKVYETIIDENLLPNHDDNQIKTFVQKMLFKQRLKNWNSKSKISKWSLGMRSPREEDFLIE
jgi:flagellar basal body-associated protein FliL